MPRTSSRDVHQLRGDEGIGDPGVRDLANVFEDIRVDQLGAADYEGYLLWRLVLFKAHEATGTAGWSNPKRPLNLHTSSQ